MPRCSASVMRFLLSRWIAAGERLRRWSLIAPIAGDQDMEPLPLAHQLACAVVELVDTEQVSRSTPAREEEKKSGVFGQGALQEGSSV